MKLQSAWVTITGKVYVPQYEIDDLIEAGEDEDGNKISTEDEAFETLAKSKLSELFPTDDPFKHNETEIDMKTLKDNEVDSAVNRIRGALEKQLGVTLRS